jgi:hypothetical protein
MNPDNHALAVASYSVGHSFPNRMDQWKKTGSSARMAGNGWLYLFFFQTWANPLLITIINVRYSLVMV